MQYDIIALQCQGTNVALGCTPAGHNWLCCSSFLEKAGAEWDFLTFINEIPEDLRIGVLDPTGKIHNFRSGVLH